MNFLNSEDLNHVMNEESHIQMNDYCSTEDFWKKCNSQSDVLIHS